MMENSRKTLPMAVNQQQYYPFMSFYYIDITKHYFLIWNPVPVNFNDIVLLK